MGSTRDRLAALLGGLATTLTLARPVNYSMFPDEPAAIEQRITSASVTVEYAIAIARKEIGGGALRSAEFVLTPRTKKSADANTENAPADADPDLIDVRLYKDSKAYLVTIDASTGKVISAEYVPRFYGWDVSGEYTELPTFVRYYDVEVGDGDQPDNDDAVLATVIGYLADGSIFWDSRQNPDGNSVLELRKTIPGFRQAIPSMRVGGKRKIIIPYTQGYGRFGSPPSIPANATLIFDVELHKVFKLDENGLTDEQRAAKEKEKERQKIPPPPPPLPGGSKMPSPMPPPSKGPGGKPPVR